MEKLIFSIIIPTFNSAKVLKKALNSISNQTFRDFEILIIDGLSSDNTLEICNFFNDERIKIFSEKDRSIYDAMNKGIKLAKGDWLYFLGSDDTLYDYKVLEDVNELINNTTSLIIYGNVLINGNAGWANDTQIYDGLFNLEKLLKRNISHQAIFYSKKIIKKESYNLDYKVCADYDLNLKLYSKHNFQYFNRVIANFTGGGYSVISKDNEFSITESAIKYFFYSLWKKEFYPLRNGIRVYGVNNFSSLKKFYTLLVYIKHRFIKY